MRRGLTLRQREAGTAFALLSPTLVVVVAVILIPILATVVFAFEKLRLINLRSTGLINGQFTLDNFASVLSSSGFFSALTTATAFGSLWLSSHPGTASMGKLLALSLVTTLAAVLLFQPALMGKPRDVGE
jgi:ABC-type sugar transport system permease subunit